MHHQLSPESRYDIEYQTRPIDRNLMRGQRWLERNGITGTPENDEHVEGVLAEGAWQREALMR